MSLWPWASAGPAEDTPTIPQGTCGLEKKSWVAFLESTLSNPVGNAIRPLSPPKSNLGAASVTEGFPYVCSGDGGEIPQSRRPRSRPVLLGLEWGHNRQGLSRSVDSDGTSLEWSLRFCILAVSRGMLMALSPGPHFEQPGLRT